MGTAFPEVLSSKTFRCVRDVGANSRLGRFGGRLMESQESMCEESTQDVVTEEMLDMDSASMGVDDCIDCD